LTGAVTWLRIVKSDLEIAVMREAAAITDAAIRRAGEVLRPGLRESDAAAAIVAQLMRGVDGISGTGIARSFFLCASPRTGTSHIPWTDDVLQHGAQVNLELGGLRHGYVAPIMRTFSLGAPSERLRKVHEAELAGLEAALDAVEPGRTCGEVAEAFYRAAEAQGVKKESRCGYAVGINWMEPTASLQVRDPTILQPNMTFHLMLGNWMEEDFGYVISETFRVTESGADVLTQSPRELFELC
jgi:Xaa-Pro aminopeptidase